MSAPDHNQIAEAASAFMTTMALVEAQEVALQQAKIVTKVLDVLTEVAKAAQEPPRGLYNEGYHDGQVELVKRLHALIKAEREG